ncbi:hypothetical protein [Neisseria sicca]|uniref:hypothetical protein n=1 Tax=Neisseria sicca TaxID=490 RepID=UPI001649EB20|nr:hypothetical protein [Neisseria sicca]
MPSFPRRRESTGKVRFLNLIRHCLPLRMDSRLRGNDGRQASGRDPTKTIKGRLKISI